MPRTEDVERKEQKRRLIMQAALKVFSKKGYSPTALDEIAQEAGIAKGTLYLYFKDKEDLISSTLMYVLDDLKYRMIEAIPENLPAVETLERIVLFMFQYFAENNEFYNIYLTILNYNLVSNYTSLFERMIARKKELFDFECQLVEEAKKQGHIREDMATMDIVMAFDGIVMNVIDQMFFHKGDDAFDPHKKTEMVMQLFLEGVGV
ncbi:MAG: TetR/AcrR family transcriptional regulator [Spirochaetes bacterium]|nr:TetR/AcrR family transcriptional regulator [Spirochaetota bacterium]